MEYNFRLNKMQISKMVLFGFSIFCQCAQKKSDDRSEKFALSYSMDEMKTVVLPKDLNEISGLEWVEEDELWAVEDESGEIFRIDPRTGEVIQKMKFEKKADFEDLTVTEGTAWVLQSNGDLYRVREPFGETSETTLFEFPNSGKRDMETILASENGKAIWIFCKDCEIEKGSGGASVFRFDLETLQFDPLPFHTLNQQDFKSVLQNQNSKPLKIQPSAAAFHPIEKRIYMISSTGNWLTILDADLNPEEMYRLDPKLFKQPEGLTFDPEGNLYISNEAAGGKPNLLFFPYKP